MIKNFLIDIIKTLFFNIIGILILYKSSCYVYEHDDISFFVGVSLCILVAISIYFIRKNYLSPTLEELSKFSIILFLYALKRKSGEIEIDDSYESSLNDSNIGEVVKELVDDIEINERKVEVSSKSGSYKHTYIEENNG